MQITSTSIISFIFKIKYSDYYITTSIQRNKWTNCVEYNKKQITQ